MKRDFYIRNDAQALGKEARKNPGAQLQKKRGRERPLKSNSP